MAWRAFGHSVVDDVADQVRYLLDEVASPVQCLVDDVASTGTPCGG
jgi:hypothetical protein